MIDKDDLVDRGVYRVNSRNLRITVFDGVNGFIGIREKFGSRYLFTEYLYNGVNPYGTVMPLEFIENLPKEIEVWDNKIIGEKWLKNNNELFDYLNGLEEK